MITDGQGKWILAFQRTCYAQDALSAELLGIYEGLQIIQHKTIDCAVLYSDCRLAVELLHDLEES